MLPIDRGLWYYDACAMQHRMDRAITFKFLYDLFKKKKSAFNGQHGKPVFMAVYEIKPMYNFKQMASSLLLNIYTEAKIFYHDNQTLEKNTGLLDENEQTATSSQKLFVKNLSSI